MPQFRQPTSQTARTAPAQRFCLSPECFALFPSPTVATTDRADATPKGATDHGLALKYVRVSSGAWSNDEVSAELHKLRTADDTAEVIEASDLARYLQLSLQPIYAKPPPIWAHPAFAAEFGDAFIGGTVRLALPKPCLAA